MKPTIKFGKRFEVISILTKPHVSRFSDNFLPRICELAVWCGNRQTKIAACELLHSIVLLLLGKAAAKRDVVSAEGSDGDHEGRVSGFALL